MKAFWWFKENSIAGMARPGFNQVHWCDLPLDEAAVFGWIGQHSVGPVSLKDFRLHLQTYVPRIFKFYGYDQESGSRAIEIFQKPRGFFEVLERLNQRTQILDRFEVLGDEFQFELNPHRLQQEAQFLKAQGIGRIVSLTENHHVKNVLSNQFELFHIGIEDLNAPNMDQVQHLVQILRESKERQEKLAVHCLAGIGRTSTMLFAAHLLLGEKFEDLKNLLSRQNPFFVLTGAQSEFIHRVHQLNLTVK